MLELAKPANSESSIVIKFNDCKCSLCKCMNNVYTRWEKWEPTTSFEHIFKKHIENMN